MPDGDSSVNIQCDLIVIDALVLLAKEFWSLVDTAGDDCWEWQGKLDKSGYGRLPGGGLAHRRAYELVNGPLGRLCVLHPCDNPPCCRPDHLRAGTRAQNVAEMIERGRARHLGLAGESASRAKLTSVAVAEIRDRYLRGGVTQRGLAAEYGVTQTTISLIVRGRRWKEAA